MHAALWQQCICLETKLSKALSLAVCSFPAGKLLQSLVQVEITPAFLSLNGWLQPERISRPRVTKHKEGTASSSRASVSAWRTEVFQGFREAWWHHLCKMHCHRFFLVLHLLHSNAVRSKSAKLRIDTLWSQPELRNQPRLHVPRGRHQKLHGKSTVKKDLTQKAGWYPKANHVE